MMFTAVTILFIDHSAAKFHCEFDRRRTRPHPIYLICETEPKANNIEIQWLCTQDLPRRISCFFVVVDLLVYVVFQYVYNAVCIDTRTNAHTIE